MPDAAPTAEEKAKLFSVYMRPWVLEREHATSAVPHISDLNKCDDVSLGDSAFQKKRLFKKTPCPSVRSFARAW